MNLQRLAYMMVWSTGLFTLMYLFQSLLFPVFGIRNTATILLFLLCVTAALAALSVYVMYQHEHHGLTAFGLIALFLLIILILTRFQYVGVWLFIIYAWSTIAHLFKIVQRERAEAQAAASPTSKAKPEPPADLPL
jgi:hypothetical protein